MIAKTSIVLVVFLLLSGCNNVSSSQDCQSAFNSLNYTVAKELCEASCNANKYESCSLLGLMYENAQGVNKDEVRAVALLDKACSGNNSNGCFHLGTYYESKDNKKAINYYQKSCDGGNKIACDALEDLNKEMVKEAKEKEGDSILALLLACNEGNITACKEVQKTEVPNKVPINATQSTNYQQRKAINSISGMSDVDLFNRCMDSCNMATAGWTAEKAFNTCFAKCQ